MFSKEDERSGYPQGEEPLQMSEDSSNGWNDSAEAWLREQGEAGDSGHAQSGVHDEWRSVVAASGVRSRRAC